MSIADILACQAQAHIAETGARLHEAAVRLIDATPGAECLDDVAAITGRSWGDLPTAQAGLDRETVRAVTGG